MVESLRLAVGPTRYLPHDRVIELDDRHPLTHGGFQIDAQVDDGIITHAEPRIGFLHRSAEKLFESRDYRQIMMLANRHDWHSALHGELVIALAVEEALGLIPPERATATRTLLAELNRINVCLIFIGCALNGTGQRETLELRERLLNWYQHVTGSRIHPMITRIGGLAHPVTQQALLDLTPILNALDSSTISAAIEAATEPDEYLAAITPADVETWGLSGPIAKAAGVDADLRHTDPRYDDLSAMLPVVATTDGNLGDRYRSLVGELTASLAMVRHLMAHLRELGDAPIDVPLPKVVRVPESTTYTWIEGPLGRMGALVVSTGDKMPWRLKLNTPSFHTMQALPRFLNGVPLEKAGVALASIFMVIGDVDR